MTEIIEKVEREEIISLYDDRDEPSAFYCGKVLSMNETHVLLEHFDKMGRYSGYILLKNENIFRVNRGGQYEVARSDLAKAFPKKHDLTVTPSALLYDLISYAKEKELVLLIELCESASDDTQGVVAEFSDKSITLDCVDDYGVSDGVCTVFLEDITVLKCDTTPCQIVKALMQLSST